jgi:hypothetical protein
MDRGETREDGDAEDADNVMGMLAAILARYALRRIKQTATDEAADRTPGGLPDDASDC